MKRLGKGLADLIEAPPAAAFSAAGFVMLRADQIRAGRFQPRAALNDASLEGLKASIKRSGIIEPIIARPIAHGIFELVAGERRFRAARALGMSEIPTLIKPLTDQQALQLALIENVQRQDLNPLEEAKGYSRLIEEFGYTQEAVADAVGKDRVTIANLLRILRLPEEIRHALRDETISLGHAKLLLMIEDRTRQVALCQETIAKGFSVRQLEGVAATWAPARKRKAHRIDPEMAALEDELRLAFGTKVSVKTRKKGGRIVIEYFSSEELTRLLQLLKAST